MTIIEWDRDEYPDEDELNTALALYASPQVAWGGGWLVVYGDGETREQAMQCKQDERDRDRAEALVRCQREGYATLFDMKQADWLKSFYAEHPERQPTAASPPPQGNEV